MAEQSEKEKLSKLSIRDRIRKANGNKKNAISIIR